VVGVLGLRALSTTNDNMDRMFEMRTMSVAHVGEIYGLQLENVQALDYALALQTREALAEARDTITKNRDIITDRLEKWSALISSDEGRRLHTEISKARSTLVDATNEMQAGDVAKARDIRISKVEQAFDPMREAVKDALQFQLGRARELRDESRGQRSFEAGERRQRLAGILRNRTLPSQDAVYRPGSDASVITAPARQ
jgi:hypothetical protein